ncbi:MAG TPA: twin transmembrane helix small protein [Gammaproteobacteria bacterium]|nr:twin transmembrane helix small protein [Gammaproteobacteria bacterium]
MFIKIFILFLLVLVIGSLGSAIFYLLQDNGKSNRVVRALTVRISLSIFAFLVLMGSYYFGLIEPNHPFQRIQHQAPPPK